MVALSHLFTYFNSRPHGGRLCCRKSTCFRLPFQLTPSRRATQQYAHLESELAISTHALTEGDSFIGNWRCALIISTHALTEGDLGQSFHRCCRSCISTHALTEGDYESFSTDSNWIISTHALTEGDLSPQSSVHELRHFNSRPHGGRHYGLFVSLYAVYFNSRPHGGRRTQLCG